MKSRREVSCGRFVSRVGFADVCGRGQRERSWCGPTWKKGLLTVVEKVLGK